MTDGTEWIFQTYLYSSIFDNNEKKTIFEEIEYLKIGQKELDNNSVESTIVGEKIEYLESFLPGHEDQRIRLRFTGTHGPEL